MNVDELALLQKLVADEPLDVEAARAEVWRRLGGGTDPARLRRRRIGVALVAALVVIVLATSAFATVQQLFTGPTPFEEQQAQGRVTRTVAGVRFSFRVPQFGGDRAWTNGPIERIGNNPHAFGDRHFLISRDSKVGGQAAEAVIFWTAFPEGGQAAPCTKVLGPVGPSSGDLIAAIALAPGTELLDGPRRVKVGGRPAMHVEVVVRRLRPSHCSGYFFNWRDQHWGPFWPGTYPGDRISVWVVGIDGKRIVIEAEVKQPESWGPPLGLNERPTRADVRRFEAEVAQIIGSIRFD
jgi:hypothetical protein